MDNDELLAEFRRALGEFRADMSADISRIEKSIDGLFIRTGEQARDLNYAQKDIEHTNREMSLMQDACREYRTACAGRMKDEIKASVKQESASLRVSFITTLLMGAGALIMWAIDFIFNHARGE